MIKKLFRINQSVVIGIALCTVYSTTASVIAPKINQYKNVIILVADGCGITHATVTRWALYPKPMAIDRCKVALVHTHAANSLITDSAPAATAFACGHKAFDKTIGVLPATVTVPGIDTAGLGKNAYRPIANLLEGARASGRATGLVATSQIQHATPAGFSAHVPHRDLYYQIALQQVYQNIDVVLGGGESFLAPLNAPLQSDPTQKGQRADGLDLRDTLTAHGYTVVMNRTAMISRSSAKSKKLWGAFAPLDMAYDYDRRQFYREQQPSLAEMSAAAIATLKQSPKGFFLFIEASKVDWASHANDAAAVVSDYAAFDAALKTAIDFAQKEGNTLVLAFSDHDNGGMSLGRADQSYSSFAYETFIKPFRADSLLTGDGAERRMSALSPDDTVAITTAFKRYCGIDNLSNEELQSARSILRKKQGGLSSLIRSIFSNRTNIGWATGGHNGSDVPLFAYGISDLPPFLDNTDIAHISAAAMGFSLDALTQKLYCPADSLFKGATIKLDSTSATIGLSQHTITVPFDRNYMIAENGAVIKAGGIAVYSPHQGRLFLPAGAKKTIETLFKQ